MPSRNVNEVLDSVDQGFGAAFDAARNSNETSARFYRFAIDETQRTQREQTDLARRWVEAPMDVAGLSRAVVKTWQLRGKRRADLMRTAFGEIVSASRKARTTAKTVASAGGSVTRAALDAGRESVDNAGDNLRRGAERVLDRAGKAAQNEGTQVRNAARRGTAAADGVITAIDSARINRNGSKPKASAPGRARKGTTTARKSPASSRTRTNTAARPRKPVSLSSGRRVGSR